MSWVNAAGDRIANVAQRHSTTRDRILGRYVVAGASKRKQTNGVAAARAARTPADAGNLSLPVVAKIPLGESRRRLRRAIIDEPLDPAEYYRETLDERLLSLLSNN